MERRLPKLSFYLSRRKEIFIISYTVSVIFYVAIKAFSPHGKNSRHIFLYWKYVFHPFFNENQSGVNFLKDTRFFMSLGSCLRYDFFSRPLRPKMQESIHLHQKLKFNLRIYLYSLFVLQFFLISMQYLGWWEIKLDSLKQSVEMVLFVALHVKLANQEVG